MTLSVSAWRFPVSASASLCVRHTFTHGHMSVAKAPADIDFGDQYSLSTSSTVINPATWCARNAKRSAQSVILRKKLTKQKTSTLAAPDPFQPSSSTRKIGENKLLSARARAAPYAKPGAGVNKGKVNPYGGKCLDCKVSPLSAGGRECS